MNRTRRTIVPRNLHTPVLRLVALGVVFLLGPLSGTAQQIPPTALDEHFRLGGLQVPDAESFMRVPTRLAADPDGRILVPNGTSVSLFDQDGRFLGKVGREGPGPGEFEYVIDMGFIIDSIWVRDFPKMQISVFSKDGDHQYTRRVHSTTTEIPWEVRFSAPVGITGYLDGDVAFADPGIEGAAVEERIQLPALIGNRGMTVIDTVGWAWTPPGTVLPGAYLASPETFRRGPLIAFSRSGNGYANVTWEETDPGQVRVSFFESSGRESWSRDVVFPETPLTEVARDSIVDFMTERARPWWERTKARGRPVPGDLRKAVEDGTYLPAIAPTVREAVVGVDGSVWLLRLNGPVTGGWIGFKGGSGDLVEIRLPNGHSLRAADLAQRRIWTVWEDDLEIPYVSQFRF